MSCTRLVSVLLFALLFAVPAVTQADETWKETFTGDGVGQNKDAACSSAESMARLSSMSACIGRMGARMEERNGKCSCSSVGGGKVKSCQTVLKVTCQRTEVDESEGDGERRNGRGKKGKRRG